MSLTFSIINRDVERQTGSPEWNLFVQMGSTASEKRLYFLKKFIKPINYFVKITLGKKIIFIIL